MVSATGTTASHLWGIFCVQYRRRCDFRCDSDYHGLSPSSPEREINTQLVKQHVGPN